MISQIIIVFSLVVTVTVSSVEGATPWLKRRDNRLESVQTCFTEANLHTMGCISGVVESVTKETHEALGACAGGPEVTGVLARFNLIFEELVSDIESCTGSDAGLRVRVKRDDSRALGSYRVCTGESRKRKADCFFDLITTESMQGCSKKKRVERNFLQLQKVDKAIVETLMRCMETEQ